MKKDEIKKKVKEKVCEIFKIKKNGEKTIKTCGTEETKVVGKDQIKSENKILKNFLIWLGILILIFILIALIINSMRHFEYNGISFSFIKEGEVIFYHTAFPMYSKITGQHIINYNIYLRNDPRKLENIPFEGEINLLEMMVINNTESFVCGGNGGIAMYNLQQIFKSFGTSLMTDSNATCDSQGRYMFVKIQPGNLTSIEQFGPACYNLNVNNCEILEVTEKFIIETFIKFNEIKK